MKNILKITFFFSLLFIASCTNDKDPIASANGFRLDVPVSGTDYVLTPQTAANELLTLTWDKSNNGVAAQPSYTIQIAQSGTNFANPIEAVAETDLLQGESYTWKVGYLNSLINQIGFAPCSSVAIDVRIKSTLGIVSGNALVQYSNPVTMQITPYITALPLMAFSSSATITVDTPKMAASGILNSDYEGYMWLEPGMYKFYKPNNACNLFDNVITYGDDNSGSFNILQVNGVGYQVNTAGYFLVKANLPDGGPMTYSVRPITWNLFGTAKTNFQLSNVPMTYDQINQVWKATVTLNKGYGIKFRTNGNLFLLGKYQMASPNTPDFAGPDLSYVLNTTTIASLSTNELTVPGNRIPLTQSSFDVVLDLRSPRNYKYTITLHP